MSAEEEMFDVFTETGEPMGRAPRPEVHRQGLWHRSAQGLLFNAAGDLLVQHRVATKDVCGDLWDHSVAEHLKPGETYLEGAIRGLAEELGVSGVDLSALGAPYPARLDLPDLGIHDYETQQVFRGSHHGMVHPDPAEVDDVRAISLSDLAEWIRKRPEDFTPWCINDLVRLQVLPIS